jgi:hypothetical protein
MAETHGTLWIPAFAGMTMNHFSSGKLTHYPKILLSEGFLEGEYNAPWLLRAKWLPCSFEIGG